jgi:putative ABC transport system permease protein
MPSFFDDVRYGFRVLKKSPAFAALAVITLALGIGATTVIYSVVYAVVLNPFPYKDVDTLMSVKVWEPVQRGFRVTYTPGQFLEIAERNTIFESTIASTLSDVTWKTGGEPQRLRGNYVTRDTFSTMGVPALLGRVLTSDDFRTDSPPACVIGYKFWKQQFGSDPHAVGHEMNLNGMVRTVVGVMPRPFMWRGADVYLPIVLRRDRLVEGVNNVHLLGRLKHGITEAQAEADLRPILDDLKRVEPRQFPEKFRVGLLSFKETFPSDIRKGLLILMGAVALLLFIACLNVSNLLLAKATSRQKEMAVRAALGAKRSRLARQLLTESLLLATLGGALGTALAYAGLKAIIAIVPRGRVPDEAVIAIDWHVLLFVCAVSVFTALLFGLAPALHTWTPQLTAGLNDRSGSTNPTQRRLGNALVISEVALSLVLLMGAVLMVRALLALESLDLGVRTDHLLTLRIPFNEQRYSDLTRRDAFLQQLLDRLRSLPGVEAAAVNTSMHPFGNWRRPVEVAGYSEAQQDRRPVTLHQVSEDYTRVEGIALLRGRLFTAAEVVSRRPLALMNQTFVRRYFDGRDPLGKVVRVPDLRNAPFKAEADSFEIVGVVADTIDWNSGAETTPELYIPYTFTGLATRLLVLTRGDPSALANEVRRQVYAIDADQPVTSVTTVEAGLHDDLLAAPRFNLVLFSIFGALGLLLAAVGIYSLMSHLVSQQTRDIGIRIALGAEFRDIVGAVIKPGAKLLLIGTVIGLAGSIATSHLLRGQIWKISPFDPLSFMIVVVVLLAAGLQACFWPALRAARVDPAAALRTE